MHVTCPIQLIILDLNTLIFGEKNKFEPLVYTDFSNLLLRVLVGFEVLTAVVIKSTVFWDITPCSPLKVNQCFGATYRLHLQGLRISQGRDQREGRWQAELLFFVSEDGGDMLLRKVGTLPLTSSLLGPINFFRILFSNNLLQDERWSYTPT
jgi:hypothetical protein